MRSLSSFLRFALWWEREEKRMRVSCAVGGGVNAYIRRDKSMGEPASKGEADKLVLLRVDKKATTTAHRER